MGTGSPEVIDLTETPKHEVIVLDSDDEFSNHNKSTDLSQPRTAPTDGRPVDSQSPRKAGLLERITGQNGGSLKPSSSVESTSNRPSEKSKKRKKRKKKTVVVGEVEEGEVSSDRGEDISEEEDVVEKPFGQSGGGESHGNGDKVGKSAKPSTSSRSGPSLLDRIAGTSEESREPSRNSKKRRWKEHERDEDRQGGRDRKRSRSRSPRPSSGDPSRRRSRSPDEDRPSSSKGRAKGKGDGPGEAQLFYIDLTPAEIPTKKISIPPIVVPPKLAAEEATPKLLLPAHVSVIGDIGDVVPVEIFPPPPDYDDEDYIDYLDYGDDDRKGPGLIRYFDDPTEHPESPETKHRRVVCKHCGAEGEHKTYECPVLICLTCGARDEHSTRSCPISKTCFACGMKGHTKSTCPNHYSRHLALDGDDCDRCESSRHQTNECPTLWRLYEYVDDAQRQDILIRREEKADLSIGEGGEGYIASDEWCYNCGESGHLGDDCEVLPHPSDLPQEPSAFSAYNIASGPFFDPDSSDPLPTSSTNRRRAGEKSYAREVEEWGDGHGFVIPLDVGKQGKKRERERLEKQAKAMQVEDDNEVDWFSGKKGGNGPKPANGRSRGSGGGGGGGGRGGETRSGGKETPSGGKKLSFGNLNKDKDMGRFASNNYGGGGAPSLRERLGDLPLPSRETGMQQSLHIKGASKRDKDGSRDRDRDRDRGRDRGRDRRGTEDPSWDYRHDRRYDDTRRNGERDWEREKVRDRDRGRDRGRGDRKWSDSKDSQRDSRNGPKYRGGYG